MKNIAHCFLALIFSGKVQNHWILFLLCVMYWGIFGYFSWLFSEFPLYLWFQQCIGYLLLCSKLFQNLPAKTIHTYYLTVSMGQESRIWAQLSESLTHFSLLRFDCEEPAHSSLMWLLPTFSSLWAVGQMTRFLMNYCPEASLSSLPHGPLHTAPHNMAACLMKASKGEREREWKTETERHTERVLPRVIIFVT